MEYDPKFNQLATGIAEMSKEENFDLDQFIKFFDLKRLEPAQQLEVLLVRRLLSDEPFKANTSWKDEEAIVRASSPKIHQFGTREVIRDYTPDQKEDMKKDFYMRVMSRNLGQPTMPYLAIEVLKAQRNTSK